jgi:ketosteroid isomerase-like protein
MLRPPPKKHTKSGLKEWISKENWRRRIMRKTTILRVLFSCGLVLMPPLAAIASAQAQSSDDSRAAVEQVLRTQQEAWNHHDLDGFMAGYWNSAELTFFSGGKVTSGWQAALDRYRAKYEGPGNEMGKLEFSDLRVEMLGSDAAFVRGAFHLTMSDGKTPHGIFTLVFRRFPGGWKIVHDHTSVE